MISMPDGGLDRRNAHVKELIALVGDHGVARVAFEEALRRRPGRIVTLGQRSRLLAESKGHDSEE
jgi:hypothetical protein